LPLSITAGSARTLTIALVTVMLALPKISSAQTTVDLLPGGTIPLLLAPQHEPTTSAKLAFDIKGPTQFGNIVTGDVALGSSLPVLRVQPADREYTLDFGVEGGVFAQFNLQTIERDLIASDWVFGVPIVLKHRGSWLRVGYRHISSHLGDEYAERFDTTRTAYNRDALDATGYYSLRPQVAMYVGARWGMVVEPRTAGRVMLRAGVEVEARTSRESGRPFLAADVRWDDNTDRLAVGVKGGARVWAKDRRPDVRVFVEYYTGPSPMGEFVDSHASWAGLGVMISP
jgi:Protein of unknown function (DUF1207)